INLESPWRKGGTDYLLPQRVNRVCGQRAMTLQAPEEDPIEPLRRIVGSARTDIQKVLAAVEKLRTLTNEAAINKMYVRSALVDLKLGVEGGKWTTLGALLTMGGPLMENADAAAKTSFTQSSSLILKFFEGVS